MYKKIVLYILILVALLAGAGLFLQSRNPEGGFLNLSFSSPKQDESNNDLTEPQKPIFSNYGPAPELIGLNKWFNSEPLTLAELQGNVVLVDFWTYSCINCIRTLPYVTKWYQTYKDQGFVIIGIHTPEFAFERVANNVETAINRYNITYPVAQDNQYKTWQAFENQFWPAHYLIDKNGEIVYKHFGEGEYEKMELAIRTLLGLEGEFEVPQVAEVNRAQTPEIYLGSLRSKHFGGLEQLSSEEQIYAFPKTLARNRFALEGRWRIDPEAAVHTSGFGRIRLNFNSAKVFMVAQSEKPITLKIYVDGVLHKGVTITSSDLYTLFDSDLGKNRIMEIEFPESGTHVFTFTFG
ncbi:MAG TPA: thioredoxin family protein [Candidatus Doudnabacteria bacterium]|nr:thioredoxin family protein [Candidatus Doudnabacteria bacterium]